MKAMERQNGKKPSGKKKDRVSVVAKTNAEVSVSYTQQVYGAYIERQKRKNEANGKCRVKARKPGPKKTVKPKNTTQAQPIKRFSTTAGPNPGGKVDLVNEEDGQLKEKSGISAPIPPAEAQQETESVAGTVGISENNGNVKEERSEIPVIAEKTEVAESQEQRTLPESANKSPAKNSLPENLPPQQEVQTTVHKKPDTLVIDQIRLAAEQNKRPGAWTVLIKRGGWEQEQKEVISSMLDPYCGACLFDGESKKYIFLKDILLPEKSLAGYINGYSTEHYKSIASMHFPNKITDVLKKY